MEYLQGILPLAVKIAPFFILALFLWGTVENYFLTRHGGKLDRGFSVWTIPLKDEERLFLSNLKEDITEIKKVGLWRTKTSFITVQNGEALICYRHPFQRTSWPIVLYVDLSAANPEIEYRLSLAMLLILVPLAILHIYVGLFMLLAFAISWLIETGSARGFLSRKAEFYAIRQPSFHQNDFS